MNVLFVGLVVVGCCLSSGCDKLVKASSFGYDRADATRCLQAAFDSGAKKVVIDRQAGDWIVRPVFLRSNQEVVLENGVTIRAKHGEFRGKSDSLFNLSHVTNVTIRGEGKATLVMEKSVYLADPVTYPPAEWRSTLTMNDSKDIRVTGLTLLSSGGDGVYVTRSENVTLERLDCRDHHRQGISVISARHLRIRDSKFNDTKGTAPQCGVDFEPNHRRDYLVDCLVENCEFARNAHAGILFHLLNLDATTEPVSVTMRNCRSFDNASYAVSVAIRKAGRKPVKGEICFENCELASARAATVNVLGQADDAARVVFKDCTLRHEDVGAAISYYNMAVPDDFSGVCFEGGKLWPGKGPVAAYSGMIGSGVKRADGWIDVIRGNSTERYDFARLAEEYKPDPELRKNFQAATVDFAQIKPVGRESVDRRVKTPQYRGKFTYAVLLPKAGEYAIELHTKILGRRPCDTICTFRDMVGTDLGTVHVTNLVETLKVKCTGRNVRRIEIDTRGNFVTLNTPGLAQGVVADNRVNLFAGRFSHWFRATAGMKTIRLEIVPEEPAAAKLIAADGKVVAEKPMGDDVVRFQYERPDASKAETYRLEIDAREDAAFRIAAPAVPIFSPTRDLVVE